MATRTHIGISAYNDKLRFNLYRRPLYRHIESPLSVHRSQLYDLGIDLKTVKIQNVNEFKEFLSIFNIITSLTSAELDNIFTEFVSNSTLVEEEKEMKEQAENKQKEYDDNRKVSSKKKYKNSMKNFLKKKCKKKGKRSGKTSDKTSVKTPKKIIK
jgi:hypothetical protein